MTKSVMPSAKATSASGDAKSASPVSWLTIFAVTVVMASKRVEAELCGSTRAKHHDHGFADGARRGEQNGTDNTRQGRPAGSPV